MTEPVLICIVGPTAVGKTAFAVKLAQASNTDIISADSRQFYKELSIGTAKPTQQEQADVRHHFINSLSVHDTYSAGDFARDALQVCNKQFQTKKTLILVGGSGLYIRALLNGLDALPQANEELRTQLHRVFSEEGITALQAMLKNLSEHVYENTDLQNPQRLMRAIEILKSPVAASPTNYVFPYRVMKIGLELPRPLLYERINNRVDEMVKNGLESEARAMLPYKHTYALQTVGYSEWFDYFEGKTTREQAIELIKQHTRNYAKRQLTWFRKQTDITWLDAREANQKIAEIIAGL